MKKPGSLHEHEKICSEILLTLGSTSLCRIWPQPTGAAYRNGRLVRYGTIGCADISGIVPDGRRLEIEVKSGNAVQSTEQVNFMNMIRKYNGIYLLCRSAEDALIQLTEALK